MRIAIAGGTGFVGKALTDELINNGHKVFILTRRKGTVSPKKNLQFVHWLEDDARPWEELEQIDVLINLAGESINSGRWSEERKRRILQSRLNATEELLRIIKNLHSKPRVFINASAIGFYGTSTQKTFTEEEKDPGNDFLAYTVKEWEHKANEAAGIGIRTAFCRFGIILDKSEGALPKIVFPYKFLAGGKIGSGKQWMSWIHIKDVIRGILFIINNEQISGPVNFTAPNPVTMNEFGKTVGNVLHRPHWLPAPSFALKVLLGEMSLLVLEGQRVLPEKLLDAGFHFEFTELSSALKNIFP